jgi:hypothetical protein
MHGELCTPEEIAELKDGHDEFIEKKLTNPVKVIGNIEFDTTPDKGLNGGFNSNY